MLLKILRRKRNSSNTLTEKMGNINTPSSLVFNHVDRYAEKV